MDNARVDYKKQETEVFARCAFCKKVLYTETYVDEVVDGQLTQTSHEISGQIEACPCRKETE